MKQLHTFTAIALMAFLFQTNRSIGQTTDEEYKFITKGYHNQVVQDGGDMKKGYEMENVDTTSLNEMKVTLKKMSKITGTTKKLAAYMLIYEKKGLAPTYYCIPTVGSDSALFQLYYDALKDAGTEPNSTRLSLISMVLSRNLK